jgi:hypothetical protein
MWSTNPSIRASNQAGQSTLSRGAAPSNAQQQLQDDTSFLPNSEAYRFGATNHQLSGLAQTPTQGQGGGSEDFPALGGLGNDVERRGNLLSAFQGQGAFGIQNARISLDQTDFGLRGPGDRNVSFRFHPQAYLYY